jgi:hypothetical protein
MTRRALLVAALAACSSKTPASDPPPTPRVDARAIPVDAAPPAKAAPIAITIVNGGAAPVWIESQASCGYQPFHVVAPDRRAAKINAGQSMPCETSRAGNCPTMGSCGGNPPVELAPGAELAATWSGEVYQEQTLRADEVAPGCPSSCVEYAPAPPGEYQIAVDAFSTCAGDTCGGAPDRKGRATITLPGATTVTVTIPGS